MSYKNFSSEIKNLVLPKLSFFERFYIIQLLFSFDSVS